MLSNFGMIANTDSRISGPATNLDMMETPIPEFLELPQNLGMIANTDSRNSGTVLFFQLVLPPYRYLFYIT
jgi:hypothetical protein